MIELNLPPVFVHLAPFLAKPVRRTIVEIGVHDGTSTAQLRVFCALPPRYVGIEPDPRNLQTLAEAGQTAVPSAVGEKAGHTTLYMSSGTTPDTLGREHTDSSSIRRPVEHQRLHPWCKFEQTVEVSVIPLDALTTRLERVDLIWCDVQGAQLDVIRGGAATLRRTTLLYIEVHPTPLYEGEPTFGEMMFELEKTTGAEWEVIERYDADVLLRRIGSDG